MSKDKEENRFIETIDTANLKRKYFMLKAKNIGDYEESLDALQPHFKSGDMRLVDYDGKHFVLWLSGGTNAKKYLKGVPKEVKVTPVKDPKKD